MNNLLNKNMSHIKYNILQKCDIFEIWKKNTKEQEI